MAGRLSRLAPPRTFAALALLVMTPGVTSAQTQLPDGDGDGIPDVADAFPCDASLAGVAFSPAESEQALVVFEDQWPSRGDLDFNDVVVGYHFLYRLDPAGGVVGLTLTLDPLALGGIYDNGLGLVLPVAAADTATITRSVGGRAPELLAPSAADAQLTIRISDNLRELFEGREGQINSTADLPRTPGERVIVEVRFARPVGLAPGEGPHDLFIFRTHDPAHEIHRPEFRGTAGFRQSLFGSADDGSSITRHFVDTTGLPFVLVLPIDNPYPQEGTPISDLFPAILQFAASGGATHRDFYVSGVQLQHAYRDSNGAPQLGPGSLAPFEPDTSCVTSQCLGDNGSGTLTCGLGACENTVEACEDGVPVSCEPLPMAEPELCDGIDNDCDGEVDEDCDCVDGATQSCYSGSPLTLGVGRCAAGTQTCSNGRWGSCAGQVLPTGELCNGIDDDCDGVVDQGFPILTCGVGECLRAVPSCLDGVVTACVPGEPEPEICDGLDNDCDGEADDETAATSCSTYAHSTSACVSGACVIAACTEDYLDCDGVRNNGCEVNVLTHHRHCGACNVRCPTNHACEDGSCVCVPRTCSDVCGTVPDGCGGTIQCPACRGLSVSAGLNFSCGLRSNGTVQCWGRNANGQLGDGTLEPRFYPVTVRGITDAIAVQAAENHACALIADGTVRCWGSNVYGQLGDGSTTQSNEPVVVAGLDDAIAIGLGRLHSCAVRSDRTVWCWGYGANGQLGDGGTSNRLSPAQASGINTAVTVSGGYNFSCATLADGTGRCWGNNAYGQLGEGTTTQRLTPWQVSGLTGAADVRAGWRSYHACAVIGGGNIRCWGRNNNGQLGDTTVTNRSTPGAVTGLTSGVAELSPGAFYTCARLTTGALRCWGLNSSGQLGDGSLTQRTSPVAVSGISTATGISAGNGHTCASLSSGGVRCWGTNTQGELGDQTTFDRSTPAVAYAFPCSPTTCAAGEVDTGSMANGCGQSAYCGDARVRLAAGTNFACAVRGDGTVACWGRNSSGQLGDGSNVIRYQPTQVLGVAGARSVVAGEAHACALLGNGSVRCWGHNSYGQLGDGTTTAKNRAVEVEDLTEAVAITAGRYHTCARLADGTGRCWGHNSSYQLGDGTTSNRTRPVAVAGLGAYLEIIAISAGHSHTCVVLSGGTARCWGANGYGQLGDGTSGTTRTAPVVVGDLTDVRDIQASNRDYFTCARLGSGAVRCWGRNNVGQLGDTTTVDKLSPVAVQGITTAVEISAGQNACARLSDGTLRCWGLNTNGQLGDGSVTTRTSPVTVSGVSGAAGVAIGANASCALMNDGSVRCWGANAEGQLGDQTTVDRTTAAPVYAFPCRPLTCAEQGVYAGTVSNQCGQTLQCGSATPLVAEGLNFSCAVRPTGGVQCWGRNNYGQLGEGTTTTRYAPVSVAGVTSATGVVAGDNHACALLANGGVRCWGYNAQGQLGDGTTATRLVPVAVSGLTNAVELAAGRLHTCARLGDGTMRCWGSNGNAQLGDGTTTNRLTPVAALNLGSYLGITGIAAGYSHTCALLTGGTARCWGANGYGQIGNGVTLTTGNQTTPAVVSGLANAVEVRSGLRAYHTCARLGTGALRCWGRNSNGQLGNATTTNSALPVAVSNISTALSVSLGGSLTCARLSNGTSQCWGLNSSGQLGDGTTTQRTTPVAVSGLSGATWLVAGNTHSCAMLSGGALRCWGANTHGELGDQTTFARPTPAPVYAFPCVPTTCSAAGVGAGSLSNDCGQTLQCGAALAEVASGLSFSCALGAGGSVECWGRNTSGQLGDGTTTTRYYPAPVASVIGARSVVAGESHACALLDDGAVACWGLNTSGQLGDGTTSNRTYPVLVSGLESAVELAAGRLHTCAKLANGQVRCWGANGSYQLGDGTNGNRTTPVLMNNLSSYHGVISVTAGYAHTCVLLAGGTVRCVGANASGQLGDGTTTDRTTPVLAGTLTGVVAIRSGFRADHTCAVLSGGALRCWGRNDFGQIGDATTVNRPAPTAVSLTVADVTLGYRHTCARMSDGTARCWGLNSTGQVGDASVTNRTSPVTVTGLGSLSSLSGGSGHTCARLTGGGVRCWGSNADGELGDQTDVTRTTQVTVYAFPCRPLTCAEANRASGTLSNGCGATLQCGHTTPALAAGLTFSCAVRDGGVWCWGRNASGQLGTGDTAASNRPVRVEGISDAVGVVAGDNHACAHLADGTVACWGLGTSGQLGHGASVNSLTPVAVEGLAGVLGLVAGRLHNCARLNDGSAWCWGANGSYQLGDATATNRNSPVRVRNLDAYLGVVGLAAGYAHTCALLTGGTMRCWGANAYGQLGEGTTTDQSVPRVVSGLAGVVEVAAAGRGYHTCARLTDNTVRCWGRNTNGQLGDTSTTNRSAPVAVSSLTGVAELSLGASQSCARLTSGALRCWGLNSSGELGDGSTTQRTAPVAVSGLSSQTRLAAGGTHGCAANGSGVIACWGSNANGELGNGANTNSTVPVLVSFP